MMDWVFVLAWAWVFALVLSFLLGYYVIAPWMHHRAMGEGHVYHRKAMACPRKVGE